MESDVNITKRDALVRGYGYKALNYN